jgi:hypothetical protein
MGTGLKARRAEREATSFVIQSWPSSRKGEDNWGHEGAACRQGNESLNTEPEESALLGTVTEQMLVKINGEDLVCAVVNCRMHELVKWS